MDNITFTVFEDVGGKIKNEFNETLDALVFRIKGEKRAAKSTLPLLKFARFGEVLTDKGSLRHDANVLAVTGCEGDYDGGQIPFEQAVKKIEEIGIEALLYTSPSHTEAKPRWRILCPFSQELEPAERHRMLCRINGVFDGALSDESFTLSQSFYFGSIRGSDFKIHRATGSYLNHLDDLDVGARGKMNRPPPGDNGDNGPTLSPRLDLTEMSRRILTGESLHPSVAAIAGSMVRAGVPLDGFLAYMRVLFDNAGQPRYNGRWPEVERTGRDIYAKEIRKSGPIPETVGLYIPADDEPPVGWPAPAPPPVSHNWLDTAPWCDAPPPDRSWSIIGIVPREEVTLLSGHGGTGKSTLGLQACVAHPLGMPWLIYGVTMGHAFFIDAEDKSDEIWRRLATICRNYGVAIRDVVERLHILSLHGKPALLATASREGVVSPTPLYGWLLEEAKRWRPEQIVIASAANVFGGNENDRVQVTQFISLLTRLAIASGGSVILISHPSLTGLATQSGISGSTAWHNAVRSRLYLEKPDHESGVRKLSLPKNQYGPDSDRALVLEWRDGLFLPPRTPTDYEKAAAMAGLDALLKRLMAKHLKLGAKLSTSPDARTYLPNVLASDPERGSFKKADFVAALERAVANGTIKVVTVRPGTTKEQTLFVLSDGI
jgi:archaellum biogenesis ATPase FlaH